MSYLEQLRSQRTERLQRMRAWTVNQPIVPANLVRRPKPLQPLPKAQPPEPEKPKGHPYWFWMVAEPGRKYPPIKSIQRAVAGRYGVEINDLLSVRREARVILPRHVAMYLSKKLTLKSLPEVGRAFANRDHTTVLHAVRKVEHLIQRDAEFAQTVKEIEQSLTRPQ